MHACAQEAVLLCHGLGDHKDGFCLPAMADALARAGLCSLRPDFPGNGESEGTFRYANMRDEVGLVPSPRHPGAMQLSLHLPLRGAEHLTT